MILRIYTHTRIDKGFRMLSMWSAVQRGLLGGVFALGFVFGAQPAQAFNYHELEVYPFQTEAPGTWEFENYTLFSNGMQSGFGSAIVRDTLEINTGLTDSMELAVYNDFERVEHGVMKYTATRVRTHLSFFEKGELPVDLGAYFEFGLPVEGQTVWEFETKIILEKDLGRFTLSLNPIFELESEKEEKFDENGVKSTEKELEFEKAYAAAISYRFSNTFLPKLSFFDQIADADERVSILFPSLDISLSPQWQVGVGAGFGLTHAAEKRLASIKLEYEF